MNKLVLVIFAFPLFFNCGGEEAAESEDTNSDTTNVVEVIGEEPEVVNSFVITGNEVGIFTIGQRVPDNLPSDLKKRLGSTTEFINGSEITYDVNMIFNSLEDVVDLKLEDSNHEHIEDKSIVEMVVHSNYYATQEGISVGSTIQEFMDIIMITHYGIYQMKTFTHWSLKPIH